MLSRETGRQVTGFSLIGVVNTLIHLILVTGLVELFFVHPILANGMAFISANLFSFWANSRWSFQVAVTSRRYMRFLAVSFLGLSISLIAVAISEALRWHYLTGVVLSFCVIPLLTFFTHKFWTYKK